VTDENPTSAAPTPPAPAPEPEAPEFAAPAPEPEASEAVALTPEPEAAASAPSAPTPPVPSPAALASAFAARPHPTVVPAAPAHSDSARFGRVDEHGTVFVTVGEEEREVGSYPGASPDEALQYFARKYDELAGNADLLEARLANPEVPAKEVAEGLATLRTCVDEARVVGDLAGLQQRLATIEESLATKRAQEQQERAAARAEAARVREEIVAEAEKIAGQPAGSTQWKQSGERMRQLLDEWKSQQRTGTKLDTPTENALWQRFSHARNAFDKGRRSYFAQLDASRSDVKATKERLVTEAERLATSKDWAATARAFKDLMSEWRRAGRAARSDDDRLWERFRAAQDSFFAAKDEVAAAEDVEFRANLAVKEELLTEAAALLPVTDLERAKTALRSIQDRWEKAGRVPRADLERTEKALRRVESAVRDAEDSKWKASNPEVAARANSMATQLEANLERLRADLTKAEASGNAKRIAEVQGKIEAQQAWLDQARAGLDEFSG
jgi:hypothetical protein